MKQIIAFIIACFAAGVLQVDAQGWLKDLGKKVEDAAKRKVEEKVQQKTEKAVDDLMEGKGLKKKGKKANEEATEEATEEAAPDEAAAEAQTPAKKETAMKWNKFDFVSGDEIIFEDNQAGEQVGEFPSQWDLISGSAEVLDIDGTLCFEMQNGAELAPLMKEKHYLPEKFTIEYDFFYRDSYVNKDEIYGGDWVNSGLEFNLYDATDTRVFQANHYTQTRMWGDHYEQHPFQFSFFWRVGEEDRSGETQPVKLTTEAWHRISISFNKRALKVYLDETRVVNIPNMNAPAYLRLMAGNAEKLIFVKNVRIAQGAVPLYDRMQTEGKFITYGITFDIGKSIIKPESMGEINRIVKMMQEKTDLKFSVEGHTDNTGTAEGNQKLSEARAKAIVDKLVELGIDAGRLTGVGKGQDSPIADNATEEGRAKNRRVEFVKQ